MKKDFEIGYKEAMKDLQEVLNYGLNAGEIKYLTQSSENFWISTKERLPEKIEAVNITWVNTNPEPYYADIKNKPFVATAVFCNGKWYWYSTECEDYLKEYGEYKIDEIDRDIKVTAWKPLPRPYTGGIWHEID